MGEPNHDTHAETPSPTRALFYAEIALVLLVFFIHAGWPVPDVNEPHYLSKAQNYWDPQWCQGDFFLESADAHLVFYWAFGWLTLWLPLPAVAWIGRWLAWGLLAWAWVRLSRVLVPRPLFAGLSAALFLTLLERFHLSGEWVVGGVEAKCFAYGLVLLAVEAILRGRFRRAWPLLGGAAALHPLVGGWSGIVAAFAWFTSGRETTLRQMAPSLLLGLALSLPGLLPAVGLSRAVPAELVQEANQIYVFKRLPHHLALHTLKAEELTTRLVRHGLLLPAFAGLCLLVPATAAHGKLRRLVAGAVLLAIAGLVISYALQHHPQQAAAVLRYYWYRLTDVFLPMGIALTAVSYLATFKANARPLNVVLLAAALSASAWHLGNTVWDRHENPTPRGDVKLASYPDWLDACRWIHANTPEDGGRYLTPRLAQTFKWHAQRPEVVNRKDIPQDARGIVEWYQRMDAVYRYDANGRRRYVQSLARRGEPKLVELAAQFNAAYLVTAADPPLRFRLLYRNGTYAVYRIGDE